MGYDGKKSDALLVDIAGGKGHDLQAFHDSFYGHYQGDLVLQEIKGVLEEIKEGDLEQSIKKMEYDFFTPQPIKGMKPLKCCKHIV